MTAKDLIAKLQACDPDAVVLDWDPYSDSYREVEDAEPQDFNKAADGSYSDEVKARRRIFKGVLIT